MRCNNRDTSAFFPALRDGERYQRALIPAQLVSTVYSREDDRDGPPREEVFASGFDILLPVIRLPNLE